MSRVYNWIPEKELISCPHCQGTGKMEIITNNVYKPSDAWRYGMINFLEYYKDRYKISKYEAIRLIFNRWIRFKKTATTNEVLQFIKKIEKKYGGRIPNQSYEFIKGCFWDGWGVVGLEQLGFSFEEAKRIKDDEDFLLKAIKKAIKQRR